MISVRKFDLIYNSSQVEMSKYAKGVEWLRNILYFSYLEPERIQVVASKLAQGVSQRKRKGEKVVRALITEMDFVKGAFHISLED
jgi:hypothetical protein